MKTKLIYIIGSLVIGIVGTLGVYFGLLAGGVIKVEQTTIVFASSSAEKVYDGTALVNDEWSIVSGKLKKGHRAKVSVSGTLTDVGSEPNHLTATIVDEGGTNVSAEYVIEYDHAINVPIVRADDACGAIAFLQIGVDLLCLCFCIVRLIA